MTIKDFHGPTHAVSLLGLFLLGAAAAKEGSYPFEAKIDATLCRWTESTEPPDAIES
jgi:hypothetical protein